MADDLIFYTNPMSRGRIVRWMLEEVGSPYRTEIMGYGTTMKSPEYLALNPMGKVPMIVHKGAAVTECAAICAYLADAFPDAGLAPPVTDRAAYYRWLFFTAGPIEAAVTNRSLGVEPPPEKQGFVGYGNFDVAMETLAQAVAGGGYLAGDSFSAADLYVGSQIGFGLEFKSFEARPEFVAYWAKIKDRPARLRAAATDDALIAAAS